jgi:two-component system chemotaxis response regulator CheY
MHILVAEDDPTCAMILVSLLKPYGEAVVVENGEEMISTFTAALAKQQPFELVCLDIKMPGLDGQTCLSCLRAIEKGFGKDCWNSSKVLMTTGMQSRENVITAFRHQCEGYLVKPIERMELTKHLAGLGFTPQ